MAAKRTGTTGSAKRASAAKRKKTVMDRHVGRRGRTRVRTVNAPKSW